MQKIDSRELIDMAEMLSDLPVRIELAYALEDNLLFDERIYRADAKLWLHVRLAKIVEIAARSLVGSDYRLVLYDGLRTTTAQEKMLSTKRVQDHPHWLEEPRLLSPPGKGAHPRGMAIDVSLEHREDGLLDMGSAFDYLSDDPSPKGNIAHRHYEHSDEVMQNRKMLDDLMLKAAEAYGEELLLLPQEWWDFRLPPTVYEVYASLSDEDLPLAMRMCDYN